MAYTITISDLGTDLCHDECNDPYVLPTAAEYECGPSQTSTPLNINVSALEPADASQFSHTMAGINCPFDGASAEDIWLRTTVPDSSGGVIIQFENNGGCNATFCQTNITYAWYTSSNGTCSGLEYRGCDAVSCFIGCSNGKFAWMVVQERMFGFEFGRKIPRIQYHN